MRDFQNPFGVSRPCHSRIALDMRLMTRILLAGDALALLARERWREEIAPYRVYGVARARERERERALGEKEIIGSNTL